MVGLFCWASRPVFCPFCGNPSILGGGEPCPHLLYEIFQDEFQYLSSRLAKLAGLPVEITGQGGVDLSDIDDESCKDIKSIVDSAGVLTNFVEFYLDSPGGDAIEIGFASREEELHYWGHEGIEPWS